jgi:hypothetical protein
VSLLTLDANATGSQITGSGTVTATITTTQPNEVIYALVMSDGLGSLSSVSVSGASLTWTKRFSYNAVSAVQGGFYVFTAPAASVLTSQVITATDNGAATADMSIVVLGYTGANIPNPASVSASGQTTSATITQTLNASKVGSQMWGLYLDASANTSPTLPAGLSKFFDLSNTHNTNRHTFIQVTAATADSNSPITISTTAPANTVAMLSFEVLPTSSSWRKGTAI